MNTVHTAAFTIETKAKKNLFILILLVALHSIFLGLWIYFFTGSFYDLFFASPVENLFFVRQTGIFLFCLGVYYLLPLIDVQKFDYLVLFTIFTKIVAVVFLLTNARHTLSPPAIYMAAVGDGIMAIILGLTLHYYRRVTVQRK